MSKTWIVTPSFCKSAMLKQGLEHFYASPPKTHFEHLILYNHYPINEEQNGEEIKDLSKKFGCTFIDSGGDVGLHKSLNNALLIVKPQDSDLWLGLDPDDRGSHGWVDAMKDVLTASPSIGVLGLNFWVLPWKQKNHGAWEEKTVAGHRLWVHPGAEMFNIIGVPMRLINAMGYFHQPNAYYGGIEIEMYHHWTRLGMNLCYLIDHTSEAIPVNREDPAIFDKSYGQWKIDHATRGFKGSFAEWLEGEREDI